MNTALALQILRTPQVTPIAGEPLRFHVQSDSRPNHPNLVDLGENDGNGQCSCEDFTFRKQPLLDAGAQPGDETRCKHLIAARSYLADLTIEAMTRAYQPVATSRRARW